MPKGGLLPHRRPSALQVRQHSSPPAAASWHDLRAEAHALATGGRLPDAVNPALAAPPAPAQAPMPMAATAPAPSNALLRPSAPTYVPASPNGGTLLVPVALAPNFVPAGGRRRPCQQAGWGASGSIMLQLLPISRTADIPAADVGVRAPASCSRWHAGSWQSPTHVVPAAAAGIPPPPQLAPAAPPAAAPAKPAEVPDAAAWATAVHTKPSAAVPVPAAPRDRPLQQQVAALIRTGNKPGLGKDGAGGNGSKAGSPASSNRFISGGSRKKSVGYEDDKVPPGRLEALLPTPHWPPPPPQSSSAWRFGSRCASCRRARQRTQRLPPACPAPCPAPQEWLVKNARGKCSGPFTGHELLGMLQNDTLAEDSMVGGAERRGAGGWPGSGRGRGRAQGTRPLGS